MEYFRSEDGQIQADIAYRLGRIILQYESAYHNDKHFFDSTLHLTVLQNLLTNCVELQRSLTSDKRRFSPLIKRIDEENILGLSSVQIKHNNFLDAPTCDWVICQLRNSISHPTTLDINENFPSTGYTTIKNSFNEQITQYGFVASPDVKRNRPKQFDDIKKAEDYIRQYDLKEYNLGYVKNNSRYTLSQDSTNPFARILIVKLTTQELRRLVVNLCSYLSQPVQKYWDGTSYNPDILAA